MTSMTMWLKVYPGERPGGSFRLWRRTLVVSYPPRTGDRIYLTSCKDPLDVEGDLLWPITNHYWSWAGDYNVEMSGMLFGPDGLLFGETGVPAYRHSYEDIPADLSRGGWRRV